MALAFLGIGHIGITTALCFASKDRTIYCIDKDRLLIDSLNLGECRIHEPFLQSLLTASQKKVVFLNSVSKLPNSEIYTVFITIGTPNKPNGELDTLPLDYLIQELIQSLPSTTPIIIRSTVPPGTHRRLAKMYPQHRFISSPEFLREGSAIQDCLNPDRIIVGSDNPEDLEFFKELYKGFNLKPEQFLFMDPTSAEMSKYAANIFLAARVSLMNEFSRVCDKNGADIKQVQKALSADPRIGGQFLNAGLGYGGSCFPKDLEAFVHYARELQEDTAITSVVHSTNQLQIRNFAEKIIQNLPNTEETQSITLWGLSFKPNTDDLREAPALKIADVLLEKGFQLKLYDPKANENLLKTFRDNTQVTVCPTASEATKDSSALVLCTEWPEFIEADLEQIKPLMKHPVIFDGRNIYSPDKMKSLGFIYHSVGRPS